MMGLLGLLFTSQTGAYTHCTPTARASRAVIFARGLGIFGIARSGDGHGRAGEGSAFHPGAWRYSAHSQPDQERQFGFRLQTDSQARRSIA